jgi:hypothetical protein
MGVDPLSLALIGGSIFASTQANKRPPSPGKPSPVAQLENVEERDGPSRRRRRRSLFAGQAQNIIDTPLG